MGLRRTVFLIFFTAVVTFSAGAQAIPTPPEVVARCKQLALSQLPGVPPELVPLIGSAFNLAPLLGGPQNNQCNPQACNGNQTAVQCATSITWLLACLTYEEVYSLCVGEHFNGYQCIDDGHKQKMKGWINSLGGKSGSCVTKCLKRFPRFSNIKMGELILRWQKSVAAKMVAQMNSGKLLLGRKICGKLLTRVLGPIGVAYTVGEIGAFAIEQGGSIYVGWQDRQNACRLARTAQQIKDRSCARRNESLGRFNSLVATPGCSLFVEAETDLCGPTGIKTFELRGDCNLPDALACKRDPGQTLDSIQTAMQEVANDSLSCFVGVRAYSILQRQCILGGQPCDPTRRPQ